jgi:glutathione synthase/RimK-type ligase-like ATP-grasp enzyme
VVDWNHHKRYLFDIEAAGVAIVPTRMVAQHAPFAFQRAVLRQFEGEVVIKPAVGIGAFGAARVEVGSEEAFAHLEALCLLGDVLIQPFVPSVLDRGEVSVVQVGTEIGHAVRKVPAAGDFRVQDHHGGLLVDHDPTPEEVAVARAAIRAAVEECDGPIVYARVDLVELDGPTVMEVELIEPELFLRHSPSAASRLATAVEIGARFFRP